uniref:Tyrosine-protein kinase-like otk n=1 Tax=Anopheles atroparvus TaxID=41427 RepID=A0A182JFE0_ANOAO
MDLLSRSSTAPRKGGTIRSLLLIYGGSAGSPLAQGHGEGSPLGQPGSEIYGFFIVCGEPISPPVVQLLKHDSERGSISLKCHSPLENVADVGEEMHVEWFRNEVKLTKSPHIDLQRRKLHIKSASSKDNGVYSCLLSILSRPDATRRLTLRSVKNYRLKLKPGAAYHGDGKIDCTKNRNVLLCRGKRGDRQLTLPSVATEPDHHPDALQGDEPAPAPAQLQLATEAASVAANLSAAPFRIVLHPSATTVNESQSATLNCGVRPTATGSESGDGGGSWKGTTGGFVLRWRKDGKVIRKWDNTADALEDDAMDGTTESSSSSMFRDDARIYIDRTNGSLVIGLTVAGDEGSYDCQITNNATDFLVTSMPAELQIISNLRFTPKPPTTKNLELGSIAKIHCKVQGRPTPTVHWTAGLDRGELPESVEDVNGTLVFRNVSTEHRGNYACVATNSQGEIRATVAVNVVIAPKFEVAPEGSAQVAELGTVQFHCVATGDPRPTIQWDKDLQYLHAPAAGANGSEEERFRILDNGTLVLTEVHLEDEGRYGCTIGNSAGLKREEVHLIVRPSDGIAMPEESPEDGFLITRAVLITMSVAFAYIILVVGLMVWCRHRRAARKARLNHGSAKENGGGGDVDLKNCEIEPCLPDKSSAGGGAGENGVAGASSGRGKKLKNGSAGGGKEQHAGDKSDDTVNSNKSKKSSGSGGSLLEQLSVPRSAVVDLLQIGKCDFGDVLIGKMRENDCRLPPPTKESATQEPVTGDEVGPGSASAELSTEHERKSVGRKPSNEELNAIRPENDYKPVMVKALTKVKDEHCCAEFRRQLELFRIVTHRNVVQLFGLCRDKDPHYLLLEYTDWGDLKQFLLATSPNTPPNGTVDKKDAAKPPPLNIPQILALAHQIGRGMDAIYKARIIHKDLATRNCIISSDFSAKISLPALARDKYSKEYCKHRNQLLPVRWMAPECFQEDDHSIKSDIFSFAVLVWELFTNAIELPQKDLSDEEVIAGALTGKLEWKVADSTPEALHKILASCWSANAKERPSFSQLVVAIGNCLQSEYPKEPASD